VDLSGLDVGVRVELDDLSVAEVLEPSSDGETIRVRYVDAPFAPELVGQEATVSWDVVAGVVGADVTTTDLGGEARRRDFVG
jgi:hypothetical protein